MTDGLEWQVGVWDRMSDVYLDEIDARFAPVVDGALRRAALQAGDAVLDLGTGTGSVAIAAAQAVGDAGRVVGVDPSPEMLAVAEARRDRLDLRTLEFRQGTGEDVPADPDAFDCLIASLSFMYVIDRPAAARECARVLRPGGRFVAALWAGPDEADIVRFQATAGRFAPAPPVPGVGPGALADPTPLVDALAREGIDVEVEKEASTFEFPSFDAAWDVLADVTAAQLSPERREEARTAVCDAMWPDASAPRTFRNTALFLVGRRRL